MDVKAAVAFKAGDPLSIETVQLEGPRAGEVLVEIKASGICHTDAFTLSGDDPEGIFPAILGHEGAGVVVEIGADVKSLKAGDHVIPLYTPECRECEYCTSGKTNLCQAVREPKVKALCRMAQAAFPSMARKSFTIWAPRRLPITQWCQKSPWQKFAKTRRLIKFVISAAVSLQVLAR